jgi:hypothetical protein
MSVKLTVPSQGYWGNTNWQKYTKENCHVNCVDLKRINILLRKAKIDYKVIDYKCVTEMYIAR